MRVWREGDKWVSDCPSGPADEAAAAAQSLRLWKLVERFSPWRPIRRIFKRITSRRGGRRSRRSRLRELPPGLEAAITAAADECHTRRPGVPLTVQAVRIEFSDTLGEASAAFHRMGDRRQRRIVKDVLDKYFPHRLDR